MSNLDMSKLHDFWWNAMIEHDSSCSNPLDSWHYLQLSWPFKRGFSFTFAIMMQGNHSAHRFRINNVFFFRCRVWCQRRLKWALLWTLVWENESELKETTISNFQLRDYRYKWEEWVSEAIRQKRTGFSYIFSLCHQLWLFTPQFSLWCQTPLIVVLN